MESRTPSDLVRRYFSAYLARDRKAVEDLLGDGFTFTSPLDDHIDKATYFERCWPNSQRMKDLRIDKLVEQGDEAFVQYELDPTDGDRFRNTEHFTFDRGKIREIEVYFGADSEAAGQARGSSADEAAIRKTIADWNRAIRARDLEGVMRHYAADFRAFNIAPPLQSRGRQQWRSGLKMWLESWKGPITIAMRDLDVHVDGTVAYSASINNLKGTRADDGGEVDMWVRATVGWRKRNGEWVVTHEHVSVPFYMDEEMRAAVDLEP